MGAKTGISWCDSTWNPIRGCTRVSAGCVHCYAETMAARFSGPGQPYEGLATTVNGHPRWTNVVRFYPHLLDQPLRWQEPRRIFVNSMSDVFHPDVSLHWLAQMWAVMALSPRHTYQILTKRPERIFPLLTGPAFAHLVRGEMARIRGERHKDRRIQHIAIPDPGAQPLPNVWLGTSVEDQDAAQARIPHLLGAPAALRFLSCEPLLGPLDLDPWLWEEAGPSWMGNLAVPGIDWIIDGGESGPGYRAAEADWFRAIRDQCHVAEVPYFHKQGSSLRSGQDDLLDGVAWKQFPQEVPV